MTLSEEMEEMGMTISMMGAELLATKKELKGALAALEETQQQLDEMTVNAVGWKEQYIAEWAKRSMLERDIKEFKCQLIGKTEEVEAAYDGIDKLRGEYDKLDRGAAEDYQKLVEAQQTIARQREALEEIAEYGGTDMLGITCAKRAQTALGEGAKES
ncbi:hypothetical protein MHH28_07805 [Paenibacillus sp. FSL K6-1217]|uniref:hypothetical protein n=1 Tax=Paenibacillus sp. FSL K6-1217 TaxID=2921466 RepID=UPI0032434B54